jgi:hypothetical protein
MTSSNAGDYTWHRWKIEVDLPIVVFQLILLSFEVISINVLEILDEDRVTLAAKLGDLVVLVSGNVVNDIFDSAWFLTVNCDQSIKRNLVATHFSA